MRHCNASVYFGRGVSSRISREKTLMSITCFLTATCAYDVGSRRPARFFVAGPSFVLAVETLRRKIEWSNLVAQQPARDRRCRRIKYRNASGTSIGIRCSQFGRGPKAAACKSSLQSIGIWRHRWKSNAVAWSTVRSVHEHSIRDLTFCGQVAGENSKNHFGRPQLLQVTWVRSFFSTRNIKLQLFVMQVHVWKFIYHYYRRQAVPSDFAIIVRINRSFF